MKSYEKHVKSYENHDDDAVDVAGCFRGCTSLARPREHPLGRPHSIAALLFFPLPPATLGPPRSGTFEFPVVHSNFWWYVRSNIRSSGRTFEFPVERSKLWSNVWKNEEFKFGVWGPKTGFQNFSLKEN